MSKLKLAPEGDVVTRKALDPEGAGKNADLMLQQTLPDLDALSCRRSSKQHRPSKKASESNDVFS